MLKSYASYFAAYILSNLKNRENIERIILFGSVARNEATKESDIDIFIEVKKKTKKFENEIREAGKKFYLSREGALFKSKSIENKFNIKIGKLREWKQLYKSIASTGIVLYGPYEAREFPSGAEHFVIVFWEKIGKNRGSFLNKLYGFKVKGKRYPGLLSRFNGMRLGKSCIMLPVQYKENLFKLLKEHNVEARILEILKLT